MRYHSLALAVMMGCSVGAASAYAAADAQHGEQVFKRCAICHSVQKGGPDGVGPNLFGVVGRKAASREGFSYSGPLKSSGLTWTPANLTKWVAGPAKMVPGTKMAFPGLSSKKDQADVVAYLATLK